MIYIIEDDENIRNLVQVALNGSGYETAAFETAEEALGAFKVKAPGAGSDGEGQGILQGSRTGWGLRRLYGQGLQRAGAAGTGAFPAAPYQRGGTGTAEAFRLRYPASGSGNAGGKGKWK